MGQIGNAGATSPLVDRKRLDELVSDPDGDKEKARLAQECIDGRTMKFSDEAKIKEQSGDIERLERTLSKVLRREEDLLAQVERLELALDNSVKKSIRLDDELRNTKTLLEQKITELEDARAQGAA